jgi:hypothetical protein
MAYAPNVVFVPSDPLDPNSFEVAAPQSLPNPLCLVGTGSSVRD